MTAEQRTELEIIARSTSRPHREVRHAKALVMAADGVANSEIAERLGVGRGSVLAWRARFETEGVERIGKVAKGRGRKPSIPQETIDAIVHDTLHTTPDAETHWSCRSMAAHAGVSKAMVQRIWSSRGIKPHLVRTFKLSNDPHFEEKLVDVVGLYLDPPERAVVLCVDEKSQIQALDRTQPSLPMKKGRGGSMTHDYKRNGTTTLFAALDTASGKVTGLCLSRHRHKEFLVFLKMLDGQVPKGLDVHLVLDNYGTHKHPNVKTLVGQAPPLPSSLHAHVELVAQPRGALVPGADRQGHPPRRVPERRSPHRCDRRVRRQAQRRSQAVHLDGERRIDHREGGTRASGAQGSVGSMRRHCTSSVGTKAWMPENRATPSWSSCPSRRSRTADLPMATVSAPKTANTTAAQPIRRSMAT